MADRDHDFDFEPAPGLPAPLPKGETILWQGQPDRKALAREAYKANWVLGYMMVLVLWKGLAAWSDGLPPLAVALPYLVLALAAWGIVQGLAALQARASIYTITTERVILRIGAALPITFTIPFRRIGSAALTVDAQGTGTIALDLTGDVQMSALILWPHLRPGFVKKTQAALRCIPEATAVGRLLSDAAQTSLATPEISLALAAE
ncbi:photosynthetic complex putative assembly protein PuhB [Rhodobacter sp. KR11]|jgi:hypothetical protein|uniref:photosynthetic complex putative assembly protein PuhB n=1 Tax=Rhodobacter sp. KR11 TaxID=2974588 RepID=UPI00222388C6|nr:photosynthetic complex putative assembly protein PuhB [Rhodobacter sp. KR11]MCW1920183.1 photosynthetic complex putative assembly protein PuhB [Rhodobacter sp. KR11]